MQSYHDVRNLTHDQYNDKCLSIWSVSSAGRASGLEYFSRDTLG